MLYIIHHWLLPIIAAGTWFGMLWAMLIVWLAKGRPQYPWQDGDIAFISDIGATGLQPLFIAGSSVMALFFVLSVAADRLLRHQSRLPRNMRRTERVLSYLAITGSIIGGVGIILVSCFNTNHFPGAHRGFLLMFIVGVALSAIFTTIEYRYLDVHHADHVANHGLLKASYIFKIIIVSVEIILAIAFGVTLYRHKHNVAGVLEWLVSFLLTFYLLSFAVDLWPAAKATKGEFALDQTSTNGRAVELGHTGGATAVGFGHDAHNMPNGYPADEGAGNVPAVHPHTQTNGNGHVGVRHFDEYGRPQAAY